MLSRAAVAPLGIDIGTTRIRVAMGRRERSGRFVVAAVATREIAGAGAGDCTVEPDVVARAIEDLVNELAPARRICVLSLTSPKALLRILRFPAMSWRKRRAAARVEVERFVPWNAKQVASVVRVRSVDALSGLVAVGIAREDALAPRVASVRRAGLRVVGVDDAACALRRAFPLADGVLDIGYRTSTLHAFLPSGPISSVVAAGGADVTRAIAGDLRIDEAAAEKRKRIFGTAGAGEWAKSQLVDAIRCQIEHMPARNIPRRLALVGNGARLAGLAEAIESATQSIVEVPPSDVLRNGSYPDDVARAAGPDWTLAASLATWTPC
jgi:type IV pilus assembly protein PilM